MPAIIAASYRSAGEGSVTAAPARQSTCGGPGVAERIGSANQPARINKTGRRQFPAAARLFRYV